MKLIIGKSVVLMLFIFISFSLSGQKAANNPQIEKLSIQANHEVIMVRLDAENQISKIKVMEEDSLTTLLEMGSKELFVLQNEAEMEYNKLKRKALQNPVNKYLRQGFFEMKINELEDQYVMKASLLEAEYEMEINSLTNNIDGIVRSIETKAELQIRKLELKYEK
jgi:hypothetical protein